MEKFFIFIVFGCALFYLFMTVKKTWRGDKKCSGCDAGDAKCSSCQAGNYCGNKNNSER